MAQDGETNPWRASKDIIPAPFNKVRLHDFGFVPSEVRQPAPSGDPLHRGVFALEATRVGEARPRKAGTAVLVGPDLLITAAHNLFDPTNSGFGSARGGYAMSVRVSSGSIAIPAPATTRFVAAPGYTQSGDRGFDIAVIRLDGPVQGGQPLRPVALTDQQLQRSSIAAYGFPNPGQPLYLGRGLCLAVHPTLLFHTADATEGESGGPVMVIQGDDLHLAGLHRAGPAETPLDVPPSCGAVRLVDGAVGWIGQIGGKL